MTKKLIIMGILMIPFLLLTRVATAQDYTKMTPEVQAKIDQNKYDGLPIYTGIYFNYEVSVEGMDEADRATLLKRAAEKSEIITIEFSASGKVLMKCKSGTDFVTVKPIFQQIVTSITGIKDTYTLK